MTPDQIRALESARNEDEWNAACDAVKAANAGRYPSDWYATVVLSGMAHRVSSSWSKQ